MKLRTIKGYERLYKISNTVEVYSLITKKFRKLSSISNSGYKRIDLYNDKGRKYYSIHRLVAEAFIKNPKNYKIVNHKDGNKLNNHSSNLEWTNQSNNCIHGIQILGHNQGNKHGMSKLQDYQVLDIQSLFDSGVKRKDIAKAYNISLRMVYFIGTRKNWRHLLNL